MGQYGREKLEPWAERIQQWVDEGKEVFAYFNNDERGNAVGDAKFLLELTAK